MVRFAATARAFTAATALAALAGTAHAQWPGFRGPNGSGVDTATGYPASLSPSANLLWKTTVPYAQSSPVVAGARVYLTASEGDLLLTLCLDADTGRELWRREIRRAKPSTEAYRANDPASPTPAADDHGVVVFFPDFGLAAYTPEGKDRWTMPLGPFRNFYGMAASPILAGDLVVMLCDQQTGSFLLAIDGTTGLKKWRTERPGIDIGWATPMVFRPAGGGSAQLIVLGSSRLDSYSLDTGEPRWWMPLASGGALGTAVASGDTVFVSTVGSAEPSMPSFESVLEKYDADKNRELSRLEFAADEEMGDHFGWVDADADGSLTPQEWEVARSLGVGEYGAIGVRPGEARGKLAEAAVLWRFKRNLPYIPAPLLYDGLIYLVKSGGIITTLDPATGRAEKQGRAPGAPGEYYASPVAADQKVFLASVEGKVTVLKAGAPWEVLAVSDLGEVIRATPALGGGRIYVRTEGSLFCFGAKPERKAAN